MAVTDYIPVKEGEIYKLSFTSTAGARTRRIFGYDINKDPISSLDSASWVTIGTNYTLTATIPSGIKFIRACYLVADTNKILEGPDSYTLYGGYVDLVKGELIRDWLINTHEIEATDGTPGGTGTGNNTDYRFIAWNLPSAHLSDTNRTTQAICNIAPYSTQVGETRFWLSSNTVYMILPNDNQAYTAIVAYAERTLNTTTYQLTPQQLTALKGVNNIWSNANGPISVQYWTH